MAAPGRHIRGCRWSPRPPSAPWPNTDAPGLPGPYKRLPRSDRPTSRQELGLSRRKNRKARLHVFTKVFGVDRRSVEPASAPVAHVEDVETCGLVGRRADVEDPRVEDRWIEHASAKPHGAGAEHGRAFRDLRVVVRECVDANGCAAGVGGLAE